MFGLFIVSLIVTCVQLIKEVCEKPVPAENWGNKDLYYEDLMNGVPIEQCMENLKNGKYILNESDNESHREPHRNEKGKIIIENCLLYKEDLKKYGAHQTHKWVEQGKYNLYGEELEKEEKRIKESFERLYKLL